MGYFPVSLEDMNFKFQQNFVTGFKIVLLNCQSKSKFGFEIMAFPIKPDFLHYFIHVAYNLRATKNGLNLISSLKKSVKNFYNQFSFHLKKKSMRKQIDVIR